MREDRIRGEPVTDGDWIAASFHDPQAFGEVFRRHHEAIHRYVVRRVAAGLAADVTVDVFERAFRIRHRYQPAGETCLPWLYAVAFNVVSESRRRRGGVTVDIDRVEPSLLAVLDDTDAADSRVDAAVLRDELSEGLASLRPGDRAVLQLVALTGLSTAEVARVLGIPAGTARSRLFRARAELRERFDAIRP